MHCAEHCSAGGAAECTWICRGRLALMVYSSSLVGFSLHISTSSRSMSPLISRPLATRPTRVTPHSTGVLSALRADEWQPALESLTAIQKQKYSQRTGPQLALQGTADHISNCKYSTSLFYNYLVKNSAFSQVCLNLRCACHMYKEKLSLTWIEWILSIFLFFCKDHFTAFTNCTLLLIFLNKSLVLSIHLLVEGHIVPS